MCIWITFVFTDFTGIKTCHYQNHEHYIYFGYHFHNHFSLIDALSLYIKVKKNGTRIIPNVMENIIPKKTPVPIDCRLAEPGPLANTIGSMPKIKAKEVMTMGRNRWRAA